MEANLHLSFSSDGLWTYMWSSYHIFHPFLHEKKSNKQNSPSTIHATRLKPYKDLGKRKLDCWQEDYPFDRPYTSISIDLNRWVLRTKTEWCNFQLPNGLSFLQIDLENAVCETDSYYKYSSKPLDYLFYIRLSKSWSFKF